MYSTKVEEKSHKTIIKEGYWRSNKNDASHEILQTYARLDNFNIHKMNIQADLLFPIVVKLRNKLHTRQVGSVTRQPQDFTPNMETISQFNQTLKNLLNLLLDYYRQKSSLSLPIELGTVK